MSNFKRFRLVDEEEYNRQKLKEIRDYNPDLMRRVREESLIEKILRNNELDPGEKIRLITGAITKQKSSDLPIATQDQKTQPTVQVQPQVEQIPEGEEVEWEEEGDVEEEVEEHPSIYLKRANIHLPTQARLRTNRIVEFLTEHPEEIGVNKKNQLVIRGEPIPGSNMTDLLNHFYNPRKGHPPKELDNLMHTLKAIHTPSSLIANRKLAKELTQTGQGKIVGFAKFPKSQSHYSNPLGLYKLTL